MKYYVLNHYIEDVRCELNKMANGSEKLTEPRVVRLSMKLDRLLVLSQRLKHFNKRRRTGFSMRSGQPSRVVRRERQAL